MYQSLYNEIARETADQERDIERLVLLRSIDLLRLAQTKGLKSREAIDAILYVNRLWGIMMEDLAKPTNDLPDTLKAGLISIGIWMLRRAEDVRQGRIDDIQAMIEITQNICDGLTRN